MMMTIIVGDSGNGKIILILIFMNEKYFFFEEENFSNKFQIYRTNGEEGVNQKTQKRN